MPILENAPAFCKVKILIFEKTVFDGSLYYRKNAPEMLL